jgi:hypothetical protein
MRLGLCVLAFFILGCTKYQYATLDTDLGKSRKGEIVLDNDTVLIRYKFSGLDCPASFQLYNKLSRPLRVDWRKCSLVISRFDWLKGTLAVPTPSVFLWTEKKYPLRDATESELPGVSEVPPHSFLDGSVSTISTDFIKLSYPQMKTVEVAGRNLKVQTFRQDQSPLQFTSSLHVTVDNTACVFANRFWITEVGQGYLKPEHYEAYRGRDDKYYVTRAAGLEVVVLVLAFGFLVGTRFIGP